MNASEKRRCPHCGTEVASNSTDALCPACLLSGAVGTLSGRTVTMTMAPGGPLSLHGPADLPCDFGAYRLLGLLGRGGMGVVYEAEERATGRRVALKALGLQLDSPDMRQRFLREGRLAARVNHPNSLYVFGSDEVDGLPIITMEIAGAGTLKDKLKARGPLPVAEAVDAILDVIAGLESAQSCGVLHRDIKPSNCFVCPDGAVKVGDFGLSISTLAKSDSLVTSHGMIMGTPAYASPEQLRGDTLDVRGDIYSVGATLYTLLTNKAPFEGENAIQVVANVVKEAPTPISNLRSNVPATLDRIVARCLAKDPAQRYADYAALRNALIPFSSAQPQPASILDRVTAGWIDFLIALLPPYVALMLLVGAEALLVRPLVERTFVSARYYFLLFGCGWLYFAISEGIWGAGLGKWLKGLRVMRTNDRRPGVLRASIRYLIPIACCEGIRIPATMTFIHDAQWSGWQTAGFVLVAVACGWIPGLLAMATNREMGNSTLWDLASGTRVVIRPMGMPRRAIAPIVECETPAENAEMMGPYSVVSAVIPESWIVAIDPVLRRRVWLLRRNATGPSVARRDVARPGRLRWLQTVESHSATWDAYEAPAGRPLDELARPGRRVPWAAARYWLHDLASELWDASKDQTLPAQLSRDQVWITAENRAVVLERPWPNVDEPADTYSVDSVAGQQQFLFDVARCVDPTSVPLHARPILRNIEAHKFERLSFLTGTIRGLLDFPADVSRGIRAASILVLPLYIWIAFLVGRYHDKPWDEPAGILIVSTLIVLGAIALLQLLSLPFRCTASQSIFRLAVLGADGRPATFPRLLLRWTIGWGPLLVPAILVALLIHRSDEFAFGSSAVLLALWLAAAASSIVHPHRGIQDRLAGTWVVRR
ncbi:MAG: protein kinase [Phycisphaerales bacterium]|nr:protein kinase [Phycisphaerales bacterium]MCB9863869.1 protein kinase [Phycisphaerales bacterium]